MIKLFSSKIFFALIIACAMGCNGCSDKKDMTDVDIARMKKELIKSNKKMHEKEIKEIDKYIEERKWPMETTSTGLRYWIYERSNGERAQENDIALISYTISLLDGKVVYRTTDDKPKYVRIGRDNVETGLHEALQLMKTGERAKFIFPSHLAFGFSGDSGKIPPNASVLYDIHLIAIQ
ncbi:MAG TPA: FKBP-type peptidyl-prolyl cis-trans isomerase [Flavobacteriales bacterium]